MASCTFRQKYESHAVSNRFIFKGYYPRPIGLYSHEHVPPKVAIPVISAVLLVYKQIIRICEGYKPLSST